LPSDEALRVLLRADLQRVRDRLNDPNRYVRSTENYSTFGYGFKHQEVAGSVFLVGTTCEAWLSADEVEPKDAAIMESPTFTRLLAAGILDTGT
jgi:hypothetical protein